jgi:predicted protein tyrosine phosphatase
VILPHVQELAGGGAVVSYVQLTDWHAVGKATGKVAAILAFGRSLSAEPSSCAHLLVHCHAGISRSTAAMTLILAQARPDLSADSILSEVLRIRSKAWPNLRIIELGDALLGRNGEIVSAVPSLYREQLRIRPQLAFLFRENGRGREVDKTLSGDWS